jgi:uncharacterized membrane protein YqaE (UPF0057 family)
MNIFKMVLAVLLPPLAVWDKGCSTIALVGILTLLFWIPGAVVAMYIVVRDMQRIPPPMEDRSADIFSAAQSFKNQPLGSPTSSSPFSAQTARRADPFDKPKNNPPPSRPKPPWES